MRLSPFLLLAVFGCDDHLLGVVDDSGPVVQYTVDYAGVEDFFADSCDACHLPGGSAAIDLRAEIANDLGDGTGALLSGRGPYVVPNDSSASLLWQSISHTGTASTMPLGSIGPLPDASIAHVREWIDAGAPL